MGQNRTEQNRTEQEQHLSEKAKDIQSLKELNDIIENLRLSINREKNKLDKAQTDIDKNLINEDIKILENYINEAKKRKLEILEKYTGPYFDLVVEDNWVYKKSSYQHSSSGSNPNIINTVCRQYNEGSIFVDISNGLVVSGDNILIKYKELDISDKTIKVVNNNGKLIKQEEK